MRSWMRRGLLAWLLLPVSALFLLLVSLRRTGYQRGWLRAERLPVPVVVVGNVFIGGTGKTPFTIWLVDALRQQGRKPGVISRGHGGSGERARIVLPDTAAGEVGDEPLLIAQRARCPVVVARKRAEAGRALLAAFPEVDILIADDGLQHYALARDVEIVLCDERGAGNGWLLPAGPLREPATRPRDFTVVNATTLPAGLTKPVYLMHLQAGQAVSLADPSRSRALTSFAASASSIAAAAGIGNPQRFFAMLRAAGIAVSDEIALPDHYDFNADPFENLQAEIILITEKDAVKCLQLESLKDDPRLWVVPVSAQVDPALAHRIVEKCRGFPTA